MARRRFGILFSIALVLPAPLWAQGTEPPLRLRVDAREAPRRILHAEMTVPVATGPLTLVYPKWIPGEHGPTGPIVDLLGLRFEGGGGALRWRRDPFDAYRFTVEVPPGVREVVARYDFVFPQDPAAFSISESFTERVGVLTWHTVVLYPADRAARSVFVEPRLALPEGWSHATALREVNAGIVPGEIVFERVSVATLVDSPVLVGRHLRTISLGTHGGAEHVLALAGDSEAAIDVPPATVAGLRRLCAESLALFGSRHYRSYTFLVALSDRFDEGGLEHHESSDNRLGEETLRDDDAWLSNVELLPHEIVHSWNGKYRIPEELLAGDLQAPRNLEVLWVYEGLTEYLGWVLSVRSGLQSASDARDRLARLLSFLETNRGRRWRPLRDVATTAYYQWYGSPHWRSWRRATDYYDEGLLLWLETDVTIRRLSGGRRSLDDFCRAFFDGRSGPPEVRPYRFEEMLSALDGVARHDWRGFFAARLDTLSEMPPLGGVTGGGWTLEWADSATAYWLAIERAYDQLDLRPSLGLRIDAGAGTLRDVVPESPAARSGLAPGMKLVAVNGRAFSPSVLRRAMRDGGGREALELLVENADYYRTFRIPAAPRERTPVLRRAEGRSDRFADILRAKSRR